MKNLAISIFAPLILAVGVTKAQENQPINAPCKYIAQNGWRVPCLGDLGKVTPLNDSVVENVTVHVKKHELLAENLVGVEGCRPEGKETKEARDKPFAVREFFTYEVNGKIFAYQIRFTFIEVGRNNSITYFGAQYNAYYFDEDGNGTFQIRCRTKGAKGLENLPAWVKATSLSNTGDK